MNALDYILDGIEAELALERELGFSVIECDREVLAPVVVADAATASAPAVAAPAPAVAAPAPAVTAPKPAATASVGDAAPAAATGGPPAFAFLHAGPLAPQGAEMVAKIAAALCPSPGALPVVTDGPLPQARGYAVLGALALRKWFPGVNAGPGRWLRTKDGRVVLVTYSPGHILRFRTVSPELQQIKRDMWAGLKSLYARTREQG